MTCLTYFFQLLNQENNSGFVKESESEHLQALQGQLQLVSDECESFKKQIYDLQTQITEKTAEVEHYKKVKIAVLMEKEKIKFSKPVW